MCYTFARGHFRLFRFRGAAARLGIAEQPTGRRPWASRDGMDAGEVDGEWGRVARGEVRGAGRMDWNCGGGAAMMGGGSQREVSDDSHA